MTDPFTHDFPTNYTTGDGWDYNPTFSELETMLQHVSADGTTHNPPTVLTEEVDITGTTDRTVNVPSDEPTLADGIARASEMVAPRSGTDIIVNIESGFTIENRVQLFDGDYGNITIQSEDATVLVGTGFPADIPLFLFVRCRAPTLDCVIDMNGQGRDGIDAGQSSIGAVKSGAGILNAGRNGLYISGSRYYASGTDFSGAGKRGCRTSGAAMLSVQNADFSNAGEIGFRLTDGSVANAEGIDVSGATAEGMLISQSSVCYAPSATADNTGAAAVTAQNGGYCNVSGLSTTGAGASGVRVRQGGFALAVDATITSPASRGLRVDESGARIVAANCSITDAGSHAVAVRNGSFADLRSATLDGTGTDNNGLWIGDMGEANLSGASLANIGGTPINCLRGSTVNTFNTTVDGAAITTGDTNFASFNSLTADGVIFNN